MVRIHCLWLLLGLQPYISCMILVMLFALLTRLVQFDFINDCESQRKDLFYAHLDEV